MKSWVEDLGLSKLLYDVFVITETLSSQSDSLFESEHDPSFLLILL